jgi:hypothetical protein
MEEMFAKFLLVSLKGRDLLGGQCVVGRIILK